MASLYPRANKSTPVASEPWVDIHCAAAHLGLTVRWLYSDGDRAGVPCARVGRARRYQLSQLSAFMHSRTSSGAAA